MMQPTTPLHWFGGFGSLGGGVGSLGGGVGSVGSLGGGVVVEPPPLPPLTELGPPVPPPPQPKLPWTPLDEPDPDPLEPLEDPPPLGVEGAEGVEVEPAHEAADLVAPGTPLRDWRSVGRTLRGGGRKARRFAGQLGKLC